MAGFTGTTSPSERRGLCRYATNGLDGWTGARYGLNMISPIPAQNQFRIMVVDRSVNATVSCGFLQKLIKGVDRKIFLVVDGHPAHKEKLVQRFAKKI